jgi:hypothetical protein
MLSINNLEVTRPTHGTIRIEADIMSLLPPLFPYGLVVGYDGVEVHTQVEFSRPPVPPGQHIDLWLHDSAVGADTVSLAVASLFGLVGDKRESAVTSVM